MLAPGWREQVADKSLRRFISILDGKHSLQSVMLLSGCVNLPCNLKAARKAFLKVPGIPWSLGKAPKIDMTEHP